MSREEDRVIALQSRIAKDGIIVGGMLIVITLVCMTIYSVMAMHATFSPMEFGTGAATVLGAIGGGAGIREWLTNKGARNDNSKPN